MIKMIAIIDYGMGNIHSVQKALQFYSAKTIVTNRPQDIESCEKAVLPGVGAFDDAMLELKKQNLIPVIERHVKNKKPFLGICLGMQLLFEKSQEAVKEKGLGILKGEVKRFQENMGIKVPHMGWNQLKKVTRTQRHQDTSECPLLKDIPENSFVYFCHSYYPEPADKKDIAAETEYGINFCSVIWRDSIFGMQFHPEKSQSTGLKILRNFVDL